MTTKIAAKVAARVTAKMTARVTTTTVSFEKGGCQGPITYA